MKSPWGKWSDSVGTHLYGVVSLKGIFFKNDNTYVGAVREN